MTATPVNIDNLRSGNQQPESIELTPNAVAQRTSRSPRRYSHQSGWIQPASVPSPIEPNVLDVTAVLQNIVFGLKGLDLILWKVARQATENKDLAQFGFSDCSNIQTLASKNIDTFGNLSWYDGHISGEKTLWSRVESLSMDQLVETIEDRSVLPYLLRLFDQMLATNESARIRSNMTKNSTEFTVASDYIEQFGPAVSKDEYADYCFKAYRAAFVDLRYVHNLTLDLRDNIKEAAEKGYLSNKSLEQLKLKMEALHLGFQVMTGVLGKPETKLVWPGKTWWREPDPVSKSGSAFKDDKPKNVTFAYQKTPGVNSTLSFLVPVMSMMSSIPIFLAWTHSPHTSGEVSDPDFWQLISNSGMQVLNIITMMLPVIYNIRLAKLSWYWTWTLAIVSVALAITAVPLYLFVRTEWSMALSFAASVAQAFVILQLMFVL